MENNKVTHLQHDLRLERVEGVRQESEGFAVVEERLDASNVVADLAKAFDGLQL